MFSGILGAMSSRIDSRAAAQRFLVALAMTAAAAGCSKSEPGDAPGASAAPGAAGAAGAAGQGSGIASDHGVDLEKKILRIGLLNDESGPGAVIGKPYLAGKRLLAAQLNAGGTGFLPEGWKLELVERDHQYNPQKAVQGYQEIKNDVLFIGHSFGTPNTLPLRDMLVRDQMIAFPASLSSEMAKHPHTPPLGPSYEVEAMRAMDFAVERAGGAGAVKAGIVYQKDDLGKDGLSGWKAAAAKHGVAIVSEQTVAPGQKDYTAVITALKEAGANYVMLTVLASATGPLLGTAQQLGYAPVWLGNTPTWIDRFFEPEVIPSQVFAGYHLVTGFPFWGEDVPGMKDLMSAYQTHGQGLPTPDIFFIGSYVQGRIAVEAFRRALERKDVTRKSFMTALRSLESFDLGGLVQPLDLTKQPYQTSTRARVLAPDMARRTWTVAAPYAAPAALAPAQ
jgi:ABC-type branched-subunit amino acid transport system substrate-binding protein